MRPDKKTGTPTKSASPIKKFSLQGVTRDSCTKINDMLTNSTHKTKPIITDSPLVPAPANEYGVSRLVSQRSNNSYLEILNTSSGKLYVQESPEKNQNNQSSSQEVTFQNVPTIKEYSQNNPELLNSAEKKSYVFYVTKQILKDNQNKPRVISQKEAFGNVSAKEVFLSQNAYIIEDNSEVKYRLDLSHLQAHMFEGMQEKENLAPTTAGCNYDTLMKVELPLKGLILDHDVPHVKVQCDVYPHPILKDIPWKITYTAEWGNNRTASTTVCPLDRHMPKKGVKTMIGALLASTKSPVFSNKEQEQLHSVFNHEFPAARLDL